MKVFLLLYCIFIVQTNALNTNSTLKCDNSCQKCNELTIECRDFNQTNFNFIKTSVSSAELITFTGNRLGIVSEPIFKQEMTQLEFLDLSNNKILRFESQIVFRNLPNLFELVLDSNQLNLDSTAHFSSLKPLSNSLERLSLNKAFTESKSIDLSRSAQIDSEIHNLLSLSQLKNLFELRLRENSLTSFNIKESDVVEDATDDYETFRDILCILPKLKVLQLSNNYIERIDFDMNCLNENRSSLEVLHLDSNRLNTISLDFINKLKTFYAFNIDFRVRLLNNPFKCDCSLLPFYDWLRLDESTNIVYNKFSLKCTHEDSLQATVNKPIIDSNLKFYCSDLNAATTMQPRKKVFFPFRNRTYRTTRKPDSAETFILNKLVLFLFTIIFISVMILLFVKYHCKRKMKLRQMNRYTTLDSSYSGTTVDGNQTPNLDEEEILFKNDKKYFDKNFTTYFNRMTQKFKNDQPISSVAYQEFSDHTDTTNQQQNSKKTNPFSNLNQKHIKQAAGTDDSETEEQTIMDAAVNNVKINKKLIKNETNSKNISKVLFLRNP